MAVKNKYDFLLGKWCKKEKKENYIENTHDEYKEIFERMQYSHLLSFPNCNVKCPRTEFHTL